MKSPMYSTKLLLFSLDLKRYGVLNDNSSLGHICEIIQSQSTLPVSISQKSKQELKWQFSSIGQFLHINFPWQKMIIIIMDHLVYRCFSSVWFQPRPYSLCFCQITDPETNFPMELWVNVKKIVWLTMSPTPSEARSNYFYAIIRLSWLTQPPIASQ